MNVLYIGASNGTSDLRRAAISDLGHSVCSIDPYKLVPKVPLLGSWGFRTGYLGLTKILEKGLLDQLGGPGRFDLALIDNGELVPIGALEEIKKKASFTVCLNLDNPFVTRDAGRWRLFLEALPLYDVLFTPRELTALEARRRSVRSYRIWQAASSELRCSTITPTEKEVATFRCFLSFVGTWLPGRERALLELLEEGINLRIYGPRWERSPFWRRLAPVTVSKSLSQRDFYAAISCSDISLGLLSHDNLDLHTTRSLEIPALGTLFLAESTSAHHELYEDGSEALFFESTSECAAIARRLDADRSLLKKIADKGRLRALRNDHFNDTLMKQVITTSMAGAFR